MAAIGETRASLRFFGDDLDPDEVSRLLQGQPTDAVRKGDTQTYPRSGRQSVARTGRWLLEVDAQAPGNLELQIRQLVLDLTPDLEIWRDLSARYAGNVFVGMFMVDTNEGCDLSAQSLQNLSERGLALGLDIYNPTCED